MGAITFSEGSGVNNSVFGKSQEPIQMFIEEKAEDFKQKAIGPMLFKQMKTNNFAEKISGMTSMDNFQPVGEGGAYPEVGMQVGYEKTIEPDTWKSSFSMTQEMIEDNKILDTSKPLGFITSYDRTREDFAASLFVGAVNASSVRLNNRLYSVKGADGVNLFHASHPSKVKGETQSNLFSDEFSEEALGKGETKMQAFCDDNGKTLSVAPNTIIIPNDYTIKKTVFAAIGADKSPFTANNC